MRSATACRWAQNAQRQAKIASRMQFFYVGLSNRDYGTCGQQPPGSTAQAAAFPGSQASI